MILAVVLALPGSARAQGSETAISRSSSENKPSVRMQLCFGGMAAGFAALLLLRKRTLPDH